MNLEATSGRSADQDQQQVLRAQAVLAAYQVVQHVKQRGIKVAALRLRPPPVTKRQLLRDFGRSQYRVSKVPDSAREREEEEEERHPPLPGLRRWSVQSNRSRRSSVENSSLLPREVVEAARPECVHRLQVVDLRATRLGDKGFVQVCDLLLDAPIHTLVLSDNGITDKGVAIFAKYARYFRCLKTLMLNANQVTSQGVALLLHQDLHNGAIERLNFQQNPLCPMACHWFSNFFGLENPPTPRNLCQLNLGGTAGHKCIGDAGVTLLVAGLIRPTLFPLVELSVADCGMTALGAKAVATLLFVSDHLKRLNVSGNDIGEEGLTVIERAVQANGSLRQFEARMCGVREAHATWVRLLAFKDRPPLSWRQRRQLAGMAIALVEHVIFYRTKFERYFGHERIDVDDRFDDWQAERVRLAVDAVEELEAPSTSRSTSTSRSQQRRSLEAAWRESPAYTALAAGGGGEEQSGEADSDTVRCFEFKLESADAKADCIQDFRRCRELRNVRNLPALAADVDGALGAELAAAMWSYNECRQALDAWMSTEPNQVEQEVVTAFMAQGEAIVDDVLTHGQEALLLLQDLLQYLRFREAQQGAVFCSIIEAAAVVVEQTLSKTVIRRPKSRSTPRTPHKQHRLDLNTGRITSGSRTPIRA